jgi:hypothetical protein
MTTQAIEVGARPAVVSRALRRPRAAIDRSLHDVIRRIVAVVVLVLALCGMAAITDFAGATTPPEGPTPGLDL